MQLEILSTSPDETMNIAQYIGHCLQKGDVLTLDGELGAGKTHFTKGIALALEIKEVVNSPTFTIIKEYTGVLPLYHMDVYRLEEEEAEELGIEEYLEGEGVCVIEWADKIKNLLPIDRLEITIKRMSETDRSIHLNAVGKRFNGLCKELQKNENFSD
ncbi:tRNA (adenosine(37)-N6)-threonylcarbamoyltransferase complex ATPase subunit type 1 TsaE [Alteribacillus bidgolensis]|uniref:tRNA threonylcarbamoyladenosine biosynthesis protein TsaE n=1 Tax=Alteribacillus bidgolensis TaxID=930129 RepID=A0A1G8K0K8_9BACI|nr:tRNA (adenosine(37)-N6)-threonylcarbamoyltransferase complex ATPase subunit type 1 TsaE [Alteribacillus bidgolensis]SDI36965.1 tRNA threonylcarbamoyladenosine biosynthesis protein TsaE [Alteribacillus bidgolensis]